MAAKDRSNKPTIVIKKEEVVEGGHHGGAWKVAYADFVTAMMAFFLLMWLLNATTEAQRKGLADYFSQTNVMSRNLSGSGQPFGGHTPFDDGSQVSDKGTAAVIPGNQQPNADPSENDSDRAQPDAPVRPDQDAEKSKPGDLSNRATKGGGGQAASPAVAPVQASYLAHAASGSAAKPNPQATDASQLAEKTLRAELQRREAASFEQAAQAIRDATASDPAMAELSKRLRIDMTPEGLRLQLVDDDRQPMFAFGSSEPDEAAKALLRKVGAVLAKLPEQISIAGHTDGAPFKGAGRTNWELSSERANATRRVLVEAGLPEARFSTVAGRADREPLLPTDPMSAVNRRIAIVVLRSAGA